ncbi:MAG: radical SAM protein, partial [Candidatus Helarchaeota archaeon]|nr:radical SAM protein [Candidatus Helarchaeota archaeon]
MYPFDINLIKSLNLERIINLLKITISYYRHSLLIDFGINGLPPVLSIEPTNLCNLQCLQCPSGKGELNREKGVMDLSLFKEIIDKTQNHLVYLLLYFQGEPMLNRNIISMIEYARKYRIYVVMNTNGHYMKTDYDTKNLIDSGLNGIIFSLDGATEDSYKIYRAGGDFNTVIGAIRRLIEAKQKMKSKSPKVYLQFIVMKHNQGEIEKIKRLGKSLNVDKVFLKSVQIYDENDYNNLLPSIEKFRRYNKVNGRLVLKK